jgi:hypothetical protein
VEERHSPAGWCCRTAFIGQARSAYFFEAGGYQRRDMPDRELPGAFGFSGGN